MSARLRESGLAGSMRGRIALRDLAFDHLGIAIAAGELPDHALVRDVDVAAEMGMSRTPVREAIQELKRVGLIEILSSRRTYVSPLTNAAASDYSQWTGQLGGFAARQAVLEMSPTQADASQAQITTFLGSLASPARSSLNAIELLLHLSASSASSLLQSQFFEHRYSILRVLRRTPFTGREAVNARDGGIALSAAISQRDADRAESAMRIIFGAH